MPVEVTTTTTSTSASRATTSTAVHVISLRGIVGGIIFSLVMAALFYLIGFSTDGWTVNSGTQNGLWRQCKLGSVNVDSIDAVRAMCCIGLIGLVAAVITSFLYSFLHTINKTLTLRALTIICYLTVLFMMIGFIIYGAKAKSVSWSFAMVVIGAIFCFIAGILSTIQILASHGVIKLEARSA